MSLNEISNKKRYYYGEIEWKFSKEHDPGARMSPKTFPTLNSSCLAEWVHLCQSHE